MITSTRQETAYFWDQVCLAGAILIPTTFLHFILTFLRKANRYTRVIFAAYLCSAVFLFLDIGHFLIKEVRPRNPFHFYTVPNFAYSLFVAYFSLLSTVGVLMLYWGSRTSLNDRRFKEQIRWLFYSSLLGYLGGGTNFLLVYGVEIPYATSCANYAILAYAISVAYIIVRHRFLDIEVIIKRTLVFAGLASFALAVFSSITFLSQDILSNYVSRGGRPLSILAGVFLIVLGYEPLRNFLINFTDRYLFQKKVNYRKLLKEGTEYLAHLKSLKWQARRIAAFLVYEARISSVSLYAYQSFAPDSLILQACRPRVKTKELQTIPLSNSLVNYAKRCRGPIELHSIEGAKAAEKDHEKREELENIIQLFKDHEAEAVIPCFGSDAAELARRVGLHLRGILFLGHQKSDEPYSEEDLDILFTLGQESSIAFENARLYDEAVNRSIELARVNEELNQTNVQLLKLNKEIREVQAALMEEKKRSLLAGIGKSVAHEVANPLTPLGMNMHFVERLLDQLQTVHETCTAQPTEKNQRKFRETLETAREKLLEAEKGKDRIKGIVQTLRDLVRERTGEKKAVQLKIVVSCAREEVKYQTYWESLSSPAVDVQIPLNLPYVNGIVHDLQGVFVNLFINALDALKNRENDKRIAIEACEDT